MKKKLVTMKDINEFTMKRKQYEGISDFPPTCTDIVKLIEFGKKLCDCQKHSEFDDIVDTNLLPFRVAIAGFITSVWPEAIVNLGNLSHTVVPDHLGLELLAIDGEGVQSG